MAGEPWSGSPGRATVGTTPGIDRSWPINAKLTGVKLSGNHGGCGTTLETVIMCTSKSSRGRVIVRRRVRFAEVSGLREY